ncbi:hypothetical protein ACGFZQ_46255 [Streptomyces sp. NPDC048254]|jgi:hypothetical protein|uniref:hypothetical protein n=1 Tax=Streptomyces sp. NPDC048254 TaxID=3365525 RepID=UPI00371400F0
MIADEYRAELARWAELEIPRWAERMTAARRKYREREAIEEKREAIENRKRVTRMQAFDNIRYAGMPAHLVREYQETRRKREAASA